VDGCQEAAKRQGVCKEHFKANYVAACTVDGCEHELFSKGRCRAHYMRHYRSRIGESSPPQSAPMRPYSRTERFEVFTRIPTDVAEVILKAAGRRDGMYEKAAEILSNWAQRKQQREAMGG
jgi:hypothetical protein